MEKTKLPPEMIEVLTTSHFSYLCTTDQKNQPHITPMFYVFDEKTNDIFILASSNSKKMHNIKFNPKIALTIDVRDPINPFNNHGVMVQGTAIVEKTEPGIGKEVPHVAMYLEGQAFVEKTEQETEEEKLAQASKAFAEKYPVLLEAQSPVVGEVKKFSEKLVRIVPKRMVFWKGPNFITVNLNK
jgi:general stress protein 26